MVLQAIGIGQTGIICKCESKMVGLRVGKHKPYCGTLFIGICTGFRLPIQQIGHLIAHTNRNMHRTGYRLRAIVEQPDLGLKGFAFEPCEFFNSRTEQLGTQRRFDKCVSWLRLCRILYQGIVRCGFPRFVETPVEHHSAMRPLFAHFLKCSLISRTLQP